MCVRMCTSTTYHRKLIIVLPFATLPTRRQPRPRCVTDQTCKCEALEPTPSDRFLSPAILPGPFMSYGNMHRKAGKPILNTKTEQSAHVQNALRKQRGSPPPIAKAGRVARLYAFAHRGQKCLTCSDRQGHLKVLNQTKCSATRARLETASPPAKSTQITFHVALCRTTTPPRVAGGHV